MPSYPVLQPDGKIAIWSTVVDHFTYFDCDQADAVSILAERYRDGDKVAEYVAQVAAGTIPLDWWQDWPGCLAWATFMHGEEDETVKEAIERTPDAMTRRYIAQCVRTCQADGRTEDARDALAEATKRAEQAEASAKVFRELAAKMARHAREARRERDTANESVSELVAANNQVAAINADLTERVADLEAKLAALPPEAIALANHIWRKQRAEPEPQSNP